MSNLGEQTDSEMHIRLEARTSRATNPGLLLGRGEASASFCDVFSPQSRQPSRSLWYSNIPQVSLLRSTRPTYLGLLDRHPFLLGCILRSKETDIIPTIGQWKLTVLDGGIYISRPSPRYVPPKFGVPSPPSSITTMTLVSDDTR